MSIRPLLPQGHFSSARLAKSVVVCGAISGAIFLFGIFLIFVYFEYWHEFEARGLRSAADLWMASASSGDKGFLDFLRQCPFLVYLGVFGAGGVFGVGHYLFVRFRRSTNIDQSEQVGTSNGG
jgi:hypothetical protein